MFDWEEEEEEEKVTSGNHYVLMSRHEWRDTTMSWHHHVLHPQDSERKGFLDKLYAIQDVFLSVQTALDDVASYGERVKKWVSHAPIVVRFPLDVDFRSHLSVFLLPIYYWSWCLWEIHFLFFLTFIVFLQNIIWSSFGPYASVLCFAHNSLVSTPSGFMVSNPVTRPPAAQWTGRCPSSAGWPSPSSACPWSSSTSCPSGTWSWPGVRPHPPSESESHLLVINLEILTSGRHPTTQHNTSLKRTPDPDGHHVTLTTGNHDNQ